eukprot:867050_1
MYDLLGKINEEQEEYATALTAYQYYITLRFPQKTIASETSRNLFHTDDDDDDSDFDDAFEDNKQPTPQLIEKIAKLALKSENYDMALKMIGMIETHYKSMIHRMNNASNRWTKTEACGGKMGLSRGVDDPRDSCADCAGLCIYEKQETKETKKPQENDPEEGDSDSCDLCIHMWHCGLCPDGVDTSGCCGGCVYRSTEDGLQCLYEGTWSECFAAKAVIQPVIDVKSIGNKYIEMKQKHFVWLCVILGLLIILM